MTFKWFPLRSAVLVVLLGAALVSACGPSGARGTQGIAVSAVNYTDGELDEVTFINPQTKEVAGGSPVRPFSGMGSMCCYALPKTWKPGIAVELRFDWWDFAKDDRGPSQTLSLEVPKYEGKELGTLWALFYPDGSTQVIASKYDPGHPQWSGKVKGWPVPSREYQLKLWQEEYDRLSNVLSLLSSNVTDSDFAKTWASYKGRDPARIRGFSGPDDPRFREAERMATERALQSARERLRELELRKP